MSRWRVRAVFLAALALVCVAGPQARAEEGCRRRVVPVTVLDKDGRVVATLSASEFRAEYRGKAATIHSAAYGTGPRRIVILLDVSGSMTGFHGERWKAAWEAARIAARNAPPETMLALILFSDKVHERIDFPHGRQAVVARLDALADPRTIPGKTGGTALLDVLVEGKKMLGEAQPGDVLYAISDGVDLVSKSREGDFRRELWRDGVRVFGVLTIDPDPPTMQVRMGLLTGVFQDLAKETGGNLLKVPPEIRFAMEEKDVEGLRESVRALLKQMTEYYQLEVELPAEVDKARKWKVEVVDAEGRKRKDLDTYYPRQLVCGKGRP